MPGALNPHIRYEKKIIHEILHQIINAHKIFLNLKNTEKDFDEPNAPKNAKCTHRCAHKLKNVDKTREKISFFCV